MAKSSSSAAMPMMDADYQAQDDARTLQRGHEIMAHPARHAAARKHAAKQMRAMAKIAGAAKSPSRGR